ncbi:MULTISPECIES: hypothetical protein [Streptomyces]|uniref:Extradiol ring-cleavage dioxygenase class III enzyme subunit B domain-containing protein n=1 Tax=Streptomyces pseudovenezuelae TaxID=67350 RepID=A0A117PPB8_9ACTN|nr:MULTISPECIES: hypothetical protein [Streptomyces]KUM84333.1 hypothetical protein AQI94_31960 [Streptomyces pseudovenezuelae]
MLEGQVPGWSADFDAWAADALTRGAGDELAAFRTRAPGTPYAHPTVDHYIPLFITLGVAAHPRPAGADHRRGVHDRLLQALVPDHRVTPTAV